jgi:hypothetical protein
MATRTVFPGGWYCEILPSGSFAVLHPARYQWHADGSFTLLDAGRIATHLGDIALPAAELAAGGIGPLYLRITDVTGFQMAGQSHAGLGTWHYSAGAWALTTASHGVSAHIFDLAGALQIITLGMFGGTSQGYRYVKDSGVLVLGDATYSDPVRDLYEYSEYDCGAVHVAMGQGGSGGLVAVTGVPGVGVLRRFFLEVGDNRFVRFSHSGTSLAVAVVQPTGAVLRTLDVSDLVAGSVVVQGGGGFAADCS